VLGVSDRFDRVEHLLNEVTVLVNHQSVSADLSSSKKLLITLYKGLRLGGQGISDQLDVNAHFFLENV
jgi:hypothetical protein